MDTERERKMVAVVTPVATPESAPAAAAAVAAAQTVAEVENASALRVHRPTRDAAARRATLRKVRAVTNYARHRSNFRSTDWVWIAT